MGRIVFTRYGAARRPPNVARMLVVVTALLIAAVVGAFIGGR